MFIGAAAWAQQSQKPVKRTPFSADVTVTFAGERSKTSPDEPCCSWFKGGGVDVAVPLWKGIGIAATLTGDHASGIWKGVDENKISVMAGPRYTYTVWKSHGGAVDQRRLQLFGQGLAGVAYGFDSGHFYDGPSSAYQPAIQIGGGLNYYLTKNFGIRPIEVDFVRTEGGINGMDTRNDMRLAAGVIYHFDKKANKRIDKR
jgi:hypothetical protein